MDVIAITGGIGSGKSVVSAILRAVGYYVYDSDKEAKRIMHTNASVRALIKTEFGEESYCGESLNRPYLAGIVFGNDAARMKLNSIVHPEVIADFRRRCAEKAEETVFLETAILAESGMDKYVTDVWMVDAPEELRIRRVTKRDGVSEDAVLQRVNAQKTSIPNSRIIVNDDVIPILPQLIKLLKEIRKE